MTGWLCSPSCISTYVCTAKCPPRIQPFNTLLNICTSIVKYKYIHGTKNCTYILFSNVYIILLIFYDMCCYYQYISTLQCTPLYVVSIAFQRKGSVIGWCQCLGELARCSLGTKAIPGRWHFSITGKRRTKSKSKYL